MPKADPKPAVDVEAPQTQESGPVDGDDLLAVLGGARGVSRRGPSGRRAPGLIVGLGVVLTVLLGISAFYLGSLRSPAQVAADAQPPEPSSVTVAVEERDLSDHFVTRARPDAGSTRLVRLAPTSFPLSVVTALPVAPGAEVIEGQLLVEVSGRPVFVLGGSFPAYRDLRGGDTGPDVRQMQAALVRLRYLAEVTGKFDADTQAALTRFQNDRGYLSVRGADPAETVAAEQALATAEQAVSGARSELDAARVALRATPPEGDGDAARDAVEAAEDGLEAAQANEETATLDLNTARSVGGPSLPLSEVVVLPDLPATLAVLDLTVGADVTLDSSVLGFATSAGQLVADLPLDVAPRFPVGSPAVAEIGSADVPLVVAAVGTPPDEGGAATVPVYLRPVDEAMSVDTGGGSVLLNLGDAAGAATPVLAVPLTAVFSRPDGSEFVTVVTTGPARDVTVETGATALGWVGVEAVGDVRLEVGDEVLVGAGP